MKRLFLLIAMICCISLYAKANGVMLAQGDITELYFDGPDSWTIELTLDFVNPSWDSVFCFYSSYDTAFLSFTPQAAGIYLITPADFTSSFYIDPDGDELTVVSYIESQGEIHLVTEHNFIFGDYAGSSVNAPYTGQSLVGLPDISTTGNIVVKDNTPSLGYEADPVRGTIRGYVYDSLNNPMPYQQLHLDGIYERIIWTDENGFFEDDTAFGMNYRIFIQRQDYSTVFSAYYTVEPDSITEVEVILPIDNSVTVNGRMLGPDQQGLADAYAIFTSECPLGPIDTFLTDEDGYFSADIIPGNYYVRYSKEAYLPEFWIAPRRVYDDENLGIRLLEEGLVTEVERGSKSGQWNADHPYYIFGDLSIDHGDTLLIDPGCELYFCGVFGIDIFGTLIARGNYPDSIMITRSDLLLGEWKGLSFEGPEAAGSDVAYCKITGSSYFNISNGSPLIEKNNLKWINRINISDSSSPVFRNNTISATIFCRDMAHPYFHHNLIGNEGGICVIMDDSTFPVFEYNTFSPFFTVFATYAENTSPSIKGNIFYNGFHPFFIYGQLFVYPSNFDYNQLYEVSIYYFPLPWLGELTTINMNGDSCDLYYNLFMDPLFVNPDEGDFHLLEGSPCIDAGDPDSPFDPDSTIADMGAFYFDQLNTYVKKPWDIKDLYKIKAVPNPNRGDFAVYVNSPADHHYDARINLYAISGVAIESREIAVLEKGENTIQFSQSLNPGIYICTLEVAGELIGSTKVVVTVN